MSLADLLPQPKAEATPEQNAAQQIDAALLKLARAAATATRTLDDRRLYHAAADLSAAMWPNMGDAQRQAIGDLEPTLRQYGELVLAEHDRIRIDEAEAAIQHKRDVLAEAPRVADVLSAIGREMRRDNTQIGQRLLDLAPAVRDLLKHHRRDVDADGETCREALGRVLAGGLDVRRLAYRLGERVGWSRIEPELEQEQRWQAVSEFVTTHLAERDPGDPPADAAETPPDEEA